MVNGCNHLALEALNAGAAGWCTAAPCLIGDKPKQLFEAIMHGNSKTAKELFYRQYDFLEFIVQSGLAAAVKSGMALQGIKVGEPRKPLLPLIDSQQVRLKEMLINLGSLS